MIPWFVVFGINSTHKAINYSAAHRAVTSCLTHAEIPQQTMLLHTYMYTLLNTSKMIYRRGASLSKHALLFLSCTQTMDNSRICHCCSMSMVSKAKTSCSHFSSQRTYYATHTLASSLACVKNGGAPGTHCLRMRLISPRCGTPGYFLILPRCVTSEFRLNIPYTWVNKHIRLFPNLQGNMRLLPNMRNEVKIDRTPKTMMPVG